MIKYKWFAILIKKVFINDWINVIKGKRKTTLWLLEIISILGFVLNYRKCVELGSKLKNSKIKILSAYKRLVIKSDGDDSAYRDFKKKLKRNRKLI